MTARIRIVSIFMFAMLLFSALPLTIPAHAQMAPDVEPSNDAERALVAQHPDEWARLGPEQRRRVLENYRRWQQMAPEERQAVRRNYQEFRSLPPEERRQVMEGLRRWRELPGAPRGIATGLCSLPADAAG